MFPEEFLQISLGRFGSGGKIVGEEFEFLAEPPANNGVIAIQPHRHCFAVSGLFANVISHQSAQFFRARWPLPSTTEPDVQIHERALCHHDLARIVCPVPGPELVDREDRGPENQKMKQRLAEYLHGNLQFTSPACTRSEKCRRALGLSWA